MTNAVPYSILDISPIPEGFTAADALRNSLDVAQHAEKWGYTRYWVAEHHNMRSEEHTSELQSQR